MDEAAHLVMDVRIERGKGYVPSTKNKREDDMIGQIPIDSIFSPILRAKYESAMSVWATKWTLISLL